MPRLSAVVVAIALCVPQVVQAQFAPGGDVIGYTGLLSTPVGAFAPVITGKLNAGSRSTGVHARVARYGFDVINVNFTTIGAGLVLSRGRARTALDVGYANSDRCGADNCGLMMAGADVQYDVKQFNGDNATIVVLLNPAVGFGVPREGGGSILTAGLSVPLSASINAGSQLRLVPYVSPGFAFSRLADEGDSQTGSRATVAGGIGIGGQTSPLLVSLSARRIFFDGAPTIYSVGVSLAR